MIHDFSDFANVLWGIFLFFFKQELYSCLKKKELIFLYCYLRIESFLHVFLPRNLRADFSQSTFLFILSPATTLPVIKTCTELVYIHGQ